MPRRGTGSGVYRDHNGYLRVGRRGPNRKKYVHRLVVADLCQIHCFYPLNGDGLPPNMDVHHSDFDKTHNCPSNLILMESAFHDHMDRAPRSARYRNPLGHYTPAPPLPGAPLPLTCPECGVTRSLTLPVELDDAPDWVTDSTADLDEESDHAE